MIGEWVLIFISIGFTSLTVQPVYFHSKEACEKVAIEMSGGKTEAEFKKK